ncbi:PUA RNA binding domain protein, putative [Metarhizium acridum CQMa 102]|uniref:PUA RNA binding domain protein, putative n=2 Tax=Metarhizium acridum TaxID=92637 RepID=E9EEJ2_METAQ|nr:PUA RNA binding domain protein, putative [Metarhizium acridum CQMa 102]EFY85643.1 PUA RNA binding domain protein, putative [Metarhizium acridum CQMa 102]
MPLVVPGITSQPGSKTEEWQNKLVGKKLSDTEHTETLFCKKDLPQEHRVIGPGEGVTMDFKENRLNVHLDDKGTVSHVTHGTSYATPPSITSSKLNAGFKKSSRTNPRDVQKGVRRAQTTQNPVHQTDKRSITPSPKQKLKSSVQRSLRQSLLTTYPLLTPHIDEILPKKASLASMKLPDRNTLYVLDSEPLFYQQDNTAAIMPHLKLVHRFPQGFPTIRIDRGAIRFVLMGATLMAPGLTSKGGRLPVEGAAAQLEEGKEMDQGADADGRWSRELHKGEPVVIMAEGKEAACAVGTLVCGTDEVKAKGKGPVVEDAHYLGDGLWKLATD